MEEGGGQVEEDGGQVEDPSTSDLTPLSPAGCAADNGKAEASADNGNADISEDFAKAYISAEPRTPEHNAKEEVSVTQEEEEVRPGSLVLASLGDWGWWPALVDADPQTSRFTRVEKGLSKIRVVFLEETPTKSWVAKDKVVRFTGEEVEEDNYPERQEAYCRARAMVELEDKARLERFWEGEKSKSKSSLEGSGEPGGSGSSGEGPEEGPGEKPEEKPEEEPGEGAGEGPVEGPGRDQQILEVVQESNEGEEEQEHGEVAEKRRSWTDSIWGGVGGGGGEQGGREGKRRVGEGREGEGERRVGEGRTGEKDLLLETTLEDISEDKMEYSIDDNAEDEDVAKDVEDKVEETPEDTPMVSESSTPSAGSRSLSPEAGREQEREEGVEEEFTPRRTTRVRQLVRVGEVEEQASPKAKPAKRKLKQDKEEKGMGASLGEEATLLLLEQRKKAEEEKEKELNRVMEPEERKEIEAKLKSFRKIQENHYLCARKVNKQSKKMACECSLTKEEAAAGVSRIIFI